MQNPHFFGYGSLVNRATHDYGDARPARVTGWRRQWRHTRLRDVAYLTVTEAPGQVISGLIAAVPGGNWVALDEREHAYDRLLVAGHHVHHDHPDPITVALYRTKPGNDADPSTVHPVLLSYLDTVVAGYLDVFGREGAEEFFATTDGWNAPVLDDRHAPIYPRATALHADVRKRVDTALDDLNVKRFRPA